MECCDGVGQPSEPWAGVAESRQTSLGTEALCVVRCPAHHAFNSTSSSFGFARKLVNDGVSWSLRNNSPELINLDALVTAGPQLDENTEGWEERSLPDEEHPERTSAVACTHSPPPASTDKSGATSAEPRHVSLLKAFLAPANLTAPAPTKHTANTIRSIYLSAKSRTTLHNLSAADFSALISLFGSLSMSTPDNLYHSLFASPSLPNVRGIGERSYWPFVAQLGGDKRRLCLDLEPSDHYWLMCAELAEMVDVVRRDIGESFRFGSIQ